MKLWLKFLLVSFLLFEIFFSFKRYCYFSIDGDFAPIVLPGKSYQTVMNDPFGMNVLLHDSVYPATNRFFTHWTMSVYFKNVPLLLQNFLSPIESIYSSCALAKTFIQFFLIFLIAFYATGKNSLYDWDVLLAAAMVAPFFQVYGFNISMGIIDHSITYTFFYALALALVMLFFLPFFNRFFYLQNFNFGRMKIFMLLLLLVFISFNGSLNPAVILVVCPLVLLWFFVKNLKNTSENSFPNKILISIKSIPSPLIFIFSFAIFISLYSFYIGKNNAENFWETIPLSERYSRLPVGLFSHFTQKLGLPLLIAMLLLNYFILKKFSTEKSSRILKMLHWFFILSFVYILLLPLGGYRSYRPDIIRRDTVMPLNLGLMLFYGVTAFHIIKNVQFKWKKKYYFLIAAFSGIFLFADTEVRKSNKCERDAIEKIAQSKDKLIFLDNDCTVMDWHKNPDPNNTESKMEMLRYWGIIKEKKLYYQKE